MKKSMKILLVLGVIGFGVNPLFAGAGHNHSHDDHHGHSHAQEKYEVSKEYIIKKSERYIKSLILADKIPANWKDGALLKTEQKKFHEDLEWVVSYQNMNIQNPKKQKLYIFVDLYGHITAANYTGK